MTAISISADVAATQTQRNIWMQYSSDHCITTPMSGTAIATRTKVTAAIAKN
jgi:hypothetical protein